MHSFVTRLVALAVVPLAIALLAPEPAMAQQAGGASYLDQPNSRSTTTTGVSDSSVEGAVLA
ncbi:MAG: hypothetical protein ACRD0U_14505, partial [Acidimicrobiales bacterium]